MKLLGSDKWFALGALGIALLGVACGSNSGGNGPCTPGLATQLVKTTGDPAAWYFNNPLPVQLSVSIKDANSCPVPSISVNWSITTGGGGLSGTQSTTNSSGIATIADSVGATSPQVIHAASAGLPSQDFQVTASAPPTATAVGVTIADNSFSPQSVGIKAGGTITWTWTGVNVHNVTFTGGPTMPAKLTDRSTGTGQITLTTLGRYSYTCTNHANMNGSIDVVH